MRIEVLAFDIFGTSVDWWTGITRQVAEVACHVWDITGATNAGLRTAFLERPGEKGPARAADLAADAPADLAVRSVDELARALGC